MNISIGKVLSTTDEFDGGRIKVRVIPEDNRLGDDELPYAFPLIPKMLHVRPKKDEAVLILSAVDGDNRTQRYYIGPIIAQPQDMYKDDIEHSSSLLRGGKAPESQSPSTNANSIGAYPTNEDVAIVGRRNSEIILRETDKESGASEIDIRCGVRIDNKPPMPANLNKETPAYIQIRHSPLGLGTNYPEINGKSTVNIVADSINLISSKSATPSIPPIGDVDAENLNKSLIDDETMQTIIDKCHCLPYGDVLVEFLNIFRTAFIEHTHPWPTSKPCDDGSKYKLTNFTLDDILSKNIRIN